MRAGKDDDKIKPLPDSSTMSTQGGQPHTTPWDGGRKDATRTGSEQLSEDVGSFPKQTHGDLKTTEMSLISNGKNKMSLPTDDDKSDTLYNKRL